MAELQVLNAKFAQPIPCKCGRKLTGDDVRDRGCRVEIICGGCGASVLEIECEATGGDLWD